MEQIKWGEFKIGDLFEVISYKKKFDANKINLVSTGGHPYIVRQSGNNGQKGLIDESELFLNEGNTISFGQDTATMFYQEMPYFTGDKIKILKPKVKKFGKKNAQFFLAVMRKPFLAFSWGASSFSVEVITSQIIKLPIQNNEIDFDFMEDFIAELEAERVAELGAYLEVTGLKEYNLTPNEECLLRASSNLMNVQWKAFCIGDLFDRIKTTKLPYKAKDLPSYKSGDNILPCLTSSFNNQGLNYYAPRKGATILKNVISIPSNSDVYRAYYQPHDFTVLSDAYAIRSKKELSDNQYLFMVAAINKVTDLLIYSYKNKLGGWNIVKDKEILLPCKDGKIDYDYMETYISAVKKLIIEDVVKYADEKISVTKKVINSN